MTNGVSKRRVGKTQRYGRLTGVDSIDVVQIDAAAGAALAGSRFCDLESDDVLAGFAQQKLHEKNHAAAWYTTLVSIVAEPAEVETDQALLPERVWIFEGVESLPKPMLSNETDVVCFLDEAMVNRLWGDVIRPLGYAPPRLVDVTWLRSEVKRLGFQRIILRDKGFSILISLD